jgi:integrase/recombinase XerC
MEKNIVNFEKYLNIERNYSNYTIKNYLIDITEFITYCNNFNKNYLNIKYTDIKSYLTHLYEKKYKSTTISRKISALRTFYAFLYDKNIVDKNVFEYITLPKKEKRLPKYLSNDDIDEIFKIIDISTPLGIRNRLILELLYGSGLRVSELCNIKLSDIDFSNKSIRIIGKGKKERIVYYGEPCKRIIDLYLNGTRDEILGKNKNEYLIIGNKKSNKSLSVRSVELILNNIIESTSLNKKASPHTLRHTFATHLLNDGCDILIVKELLGHSSLDTTGIYTHISNERLRKVYLNNHPRAKK